MDWLTLTLAYGDRLVRVHSHSSRGAVVRFTVGDRTPAAVPVELGR